MPACYKVARSSYGKLATSQLHYRELKPKPRKRARLHAWRLGVSGGFKLPVEALAVFREREANNKADGLGSLAPSCSFSFPPAGPPEPTITSQVSPEQLELRASLPGSTRERERDRDTVSLALLLRSIHQAHAPSETAFALRRSQGVTHR